MTKLAVLYDLSALVSENLQKSAEEIADALEMSPVDIERTIGRAAPKYASGKISQGDYWADIAGQLLLEDLEVPAVYALRKAVVNEALLSRIRVQSAHLVLGLVSDATPDWVGHWRKQLSLDKLLHVHVIDSELDRHHQYGELLKLCAERLQRQPTEVTFVAEKPAHLETARALGMPVIVAGPETDYRAAFAALA